MEGKSGIQAIQEVMLQNTPVEVIEGDGDNTVISGIENELGVRIKKKLDRNYCVKTIVKYYMTCETVKNQRSAIR